MLAQIFAYVFGSFIATISLGHVLLAPALLGPSTDPGLRFPPGRTTENAPIWNSGRHSLRAVALEATQSY